VSDNPQPQDVYRLSQEAFALAKEAADRGHPEDLQEKARAINARLDELLAVAQSAADPGVARAWSDARLDVAYVLSKGELSMSPRLAAHLGTG
jgi:hypothetical protein